MRVSPLLFNIFFAAVLNVVVLQRFSEESAIVAELMHLKERPRNRTGAGYGLRSPCGVGYTVRG